MARVELINLSKNATQNETIAYVGHTENGITAEKYVKDLIKAGVYNPDYDELKVKMYDDNNKLVSEYLWEKSE